MYTIYRAFKKVSGLSLGLLKPKYKVFHSREHEVCQLYIFSGRPKAFMTTLYIWRKNSIWCFVAKRKWRNSIFDLNIDYFTCIFCLLHTEHHCAIEPAIFCLCRGRYSLVRIRRPCRRTLGFPGKEKTIDCQWICEKTKIM